LRSRAKRAPSNSFHDVFETIEYELLRIALDLPKARGSVGVISTWQ
jgi:hypothetical protein